MGPVIDADQRDRILSYIEGARAEGATVALGGTTMAGRGFTKGFWVAPTILTGVHRDIRVAREEVFGPVLSVIAYDTDEEAVAIASDSDYGLAASIWSTDNARALSIAEWIQSGSVWINDAHGINCQLAFGGYKQSGWAASLAPMRSTRTPRSRPWRWTSPADAPPSPTAFCSATPKTETPPDRSFR